MTNQLWTATSGYFLRPVTLLKTYRHQNLRADMMAGATVAVMMLPMAIAYATIAELPPVTGLYAAIVGSIAGGLWGSSNHLQTGPTNPASLLVLATLLPIAATGSERYLAAAGLLAVMVGVFQLLLGIGRMGVLVNFISDSVIIGFTAGAGVLIGASQLRHLLRLDIPSSSSLLDSLASIGQHLPETHWPSLFLGVAVLITLALLRRFKPQWPGTLLCIIVSASIVGIFHLNQVGIEGIGELPRSLPPLANIPLFDLRLIRDLSSGALATGAIGLVSAVAISRSFAGKTGQHLDNNQEFVGQGMANVLSGFFSGYCVFGSFTRSAVNYNAGAKTSLSSVFAGIFVLVAMLLLAPLATYVPRTALAGVLIITAYGMVDRAEITRILQGTRGDAFIMVTTFLATLILPLQFAVITGILMSFAVYVMRTSVPRVVPVLPARKFDHFSPLVNTPPCPQLAILDIFGDLYFGAISHVEEAIRSHLEANPTQRYLLLRMFSVDQIDISGVHALESIVRSMRERGGDVFLMRTQKPVMDVFKSTGFYDYLGEDHFLAYGDAIGHLFYKVLDPVICIYECEARAFLECQNLPKQTLPPGMETITTRVPEGTIQTITPQELWQEMHKKIPPVLIDVREPREFHQGHIPGSQSIPLLKLLNDPSAIPRIRDVVFICRTGRRGRRACLALGNLGFTNVRALEGGILAWEKAGLLEAIDDENDEAAPPEEM